MIFWCVDGVTQPFFLSYFKSDFVAFFFFLEARKKCSNLGGDC